MEEPIDPDELQRYREAHRRTRNITWALVLLVVAATGLSVMLLVSFDVGFILFLLLAFAAAPVQLRIDRVLWLRRFPQLRDGSVHWRRAS